MNEFSDLERLAMRRALLIAMGGLYSTGENPRVGACFSSEMVRFFQKDFIVRLGYRTRKLKQFEESRRHSFKDRLVS